jgi:glycosyltransferase involved in cell wall biosynthesis
MPTETVAVIIPTYNRGERIIAAVRSAEQQSYGSIRIIVVVDGSSDETMPLLHHYRDGLPRISRERLEVRYQENRGVSAARNEGIRATDNGFIALLDDDDLWHPEKLARQMQALRGRTAAECLLCTTDFIAVAPDSDASVLVECASCMNLAGQIRLGRFPPPSSWLFSRGAFEAAGGFDEALHAGEDVDFVTNLRRLNASICNVDDPLTYYVDSPGKVYRDQEAGAVRTLLRHHAWWATVLSPDDYDTVMKWYRKILPARVYREATEQLRQISS